MRKLILIAVILAVTIYAFRTYLSPKAVKTGWKMQNFKTMELPSRPNYYLSCFTMDCPPGDNYTPSPIFNINRHILMQNFDEMIKDKPRLTLLKSTNGGARRVYVQLSALWHFPDFIYVQFVSIGSDQSSINILSKSHYGYTDFGVNSRRVKSWLKELEE